MRGIGQTFPLCMGEERVLVGPVACVWEGE